MTHKQEELVALIREIRTAFNRLKSVAEVLHTDLEINPSMRAILQTLINKAPQTVPEIARAKSVSRQHVQKNMNALLQKGLVHAQNNPDHKRSVLFLPTLAGKKLFAEIQAREEAPMTELEEALAAYDVAAAVRLLACLNKTIETMMEKGS
ncbi:MarR family transcriptional regulator [Aliiroseovarius sp. S2029]|uniref:MarR family winged helix-turn-helix transcriptional regulator n=1 Tax=Aliiroseovarius sp. S2029 TaxID=2936988 RepID=UPI0020BE7BCF|nr:helix-turn-helix domain-containing protein [Aliiroseovarius sp. S2029]MCK8482955.1 MarR family transcriptional regulator [Aliiroseovarius sp. S2029]